MFRLSNIISNIFTLFIVLCLSRNIYSQQSAFAIGLNGSKVVSSGSEILNLGWGWNLGVFEGLSDQFHIGARVSYNSYGISNTQSGLFFSPITNVKSFSMYEATALIRFYPAPENTLLFIQLGGGLYRMSVSSDDDGDSINEFGVNIGTGLIFDLGIIPKFELCPDLRTIFTEGKTTFVAGVSFGIVFM